MVPECSEVTENEGIRHGEGQEGHLHYVSNEKSDQEFWTGTIAVSWDHGAIEMSKSVLWLKTLREMLELLILPLERIKLVSQRTMKSIKMELRK